MEGEMELLVRYRRAQDAEAFRALVEGHQDMVFAACHRILGNHADAEDAAQDCFFRLARHADSLRPPIAGWLHTVAVRVALDALRKRKSLKARHEAARREARRPPPPDPTWDEMKGAVDTAIAQLPDRLRVPLVLYYLEQRTQEEIAGELGISQPAVSQRLKRAVGALRRRLKRRGFTSLESALAPLLAGHAVEAAPASLTAALGKMAVAGITPGGTAAGTAAVAGGLGAGKAAALVVTAAVVIAALALLVHLAGLELKTAQGAATAGQAAHRRRLRARRRQATRLRRPRRSPRPARSCSIRTARERTCSWTWTPAVSTTCPDRWPRPRPWWPGCGAPARTSSTRGPSAAPTCWRWTCRWRRCRPPTRRRGPPRSSAGRPRRPPGRP